MRSAIGIVLICVAFASALTFGICHYRQTQHIAYLKSDPRRFYGTLKMEPPITHSGFSYFLDGGSITTLLTDHNGVKLSLCFSPPGEFFGDTEAFIGTREAMWSDYHARNQTDGPPEDGYRPKATRIPRGSRSARDIAGFVADAVDTMNQQYREMEPENEWERWHIAEFARCNKVFGARIHHILTSETPVDGRWGYGEPHAPMPDPPESAKRGSFR